MPTVNSNPAPDNFQSRLAAALDSVRSARPQEASDAPAESSPTVATATEEPTQVEQASATPAAPTEPVCEPDDSFFDDPAPAGPAPEAAQRTPREPLVTLGRGNYEVRRGDCIASIAAAHGLFWETVWNDPANADLKAGRRDPHVLLPGDRVHVRDRRRKEEPGATETRHRFKMRGEPCELLVTLVDEDDQPRAGAPYRLQVDGPAHTGVLDADGTLQVKIPSGTRNAHLIVGEAPFEEHYRLQLGALAPEDSQRGVQARLRNLGYLIGASDDIMPEQELSDFQEQHGLPTTGELDAATQDQLRNEHHSVGE